jgi:hypothetical protein
MAEQQSTGISTSGRQVLLIGDKAYPYWEVYTDFGFNLPVQQYSGQIIVCHYYEFGGTPVFVELRTVRYEQQVTGVVLSAQEMNLSRVALLGNWIRGGVPWSVLATDLPYP